MGGLLAVEDVMGEWQGMLGKPWKAAMCDRYWASEALVVSSSCPSGRLRNANVFPEKIWGQSVN